MQCYHCLLLHYLLKTIKQLSEFPLRSTSLTIYFYRTLLSVISENIIFILNCNIIFTRIPLHRIQTSRRTIEDMRTSMTKIGNRYSEDYLRFPETDLTDYLDVRITLHISILPQKCKYFFLSTVTICKMS